MHTTISTPTNPTNPTTAAAATYTPPASIVSALDLEIQELESKVAKAKSKLYIRDAEAALQYLRDARDGKRSKCPNVIASNIIYRVAWSYGE